MKPAKKTVRLTPQLLKSIVEEEVKKGFGDVEDVEKVPGKTKEVDADEFGDDSNTEQHINFQKANKIKESDSLDEHMDYMKALKIEEHRLTKRLTKIREALNKGAKKLVIARVV